MTCMDRSASVTAQKPSQAANGKSRHPARKPAAPVAAKRRVRAMLDELKKSGEQLSANADLLLKRLS
jgi:hypothetical protein